MASVKIRLFAEARELAGAASVSIEVHAQGKATVGAVLQALGSELGGKLGGRVLQRDGARWKLADGYKLLVDGAIIHGEASLFSRELEDGQEIGILPPFSGGC